MFLDRCPSLHGCRIWSETKHNAFKVTEKNCKMNISVLYPIRVFYFFKDIFGIFNANYKNLKKAQNFCCRKVFGDGENLNRRKFRLILFSPIR